jgi:RNA polymerase sigma factor for flagellar operon FliA
MLHLQHAPGDILGFGIHASVAEPAHLKAPGPAVSIDPLETLRQLMPMVRRMALGFSKLPPSLEVNDLIQLGLVGLLQAAQRYTGPLADFRYFSIARRRGAMLDGLRECDSAPRSLRRQVRHMQRCVLRLQQSLTRSPSSDEIAAEMKLTLKEYQSVVREYAAHAPVHGDCLDEIGAIRSPDDDPLQALLRDCTDHAVSEAITLLPDRERQILRLYYQEEVKLRVIGVMLGVSESRVSQLLTQAKARLRARVAMG